jgi:anti-anti-sigma regulatory factor
VGAGIERPVITETESDLTANVALRQEKLLLQIEMAESPQGCEVRLAGDLLGETTLGLLGVEPMLANEASVLLDVSGVTSVDGAGLEGLLRLVEAVHRGGGRLAIGCHQVAGNTFKCSDLAFENSKHAPGVMSLKRLTVRK